ncbi:MAG: hypothetical protein ABIK96_16220 [bacterium]
MGLFDRFRRHSRSPRCPVTPDDRRWIENSFAWFAEEFGDEALRKGPVILPTAEFFPEVYEPGPEGVEDLMRRICGWMDVDRSSVVLDFYEGRERPDYGLGVYKTSGPAGVMGWDESLRRWVVAVSDRLLPDPLAVVAVLAHELAHVHLFGFGRVDPQAEEDHEPLTDLLSIYFGFGVFVGKVAFRSLQEDRGTSATWSAQRLGYLPEPLIGYALALVAVAKDQTAPAWAGSLEYGVRKPFEESLAFLQHERQRDLESLLGDG